MYDLLVKKLTGNMKCEKFKLIILIKIPFSNKMDKIIDNLYLGDIRAAANLFLLK